MEVKLLDRVRAAIRARHYSRRTEEAYLSWFLYEVILGRRLSWMDAIVRAQRPVRLPVVLSRAEVAAVLSRLHGTMWLMASLLYGGGLRLLECVELRVKDLNFDRGELTVRDGKGGKDRVTILPTAGADAALRRTCWRPGMTSGRFRNCWGIAM
jgi:integrase